MKELLFSVTKKDLRIEHFCARGPGGQHQNKTASACRITHVASGAVGECREERSQGMNTKVAFRRMVQTARFQTWMKIRAAELMMGETVEQKVDRLMSPQFLKVEVKDEKGRWVSDSALHKEHNASPSLLPDMQQEHDAPGR